LFSRRFAMMRPKTAVPTMNRILRMLVLLLLAGVLLG
jgi:hypothetical protein